MGNNDVQILGRMKPEYSSILTPEAVQFAGHIQRKFGDRVLDLLQKRKERQARFDAGEKPDFLKETKSIREGNWKVAPLPKDLLDRRVEITGPVDRKMVINALNSGASVFMADFEDSNAPTWTNQMDGHVNLRDAAKGQCSFKDSKSGKEYSLKPKHAVLMVRPRGWHLPEKHILVDGKPCSGALMDFALYFFNSAHALIKNGSGPYFYLPKMQSHKEARLWNDVFIEAQDMLNIPRGTIKATVLIETLPGAFEMDEILFELREHSAGLNCGRWDYIFSFIKTLREDPKAVMPDRSTVGMTVGFLRSYSLGVIRTCHKRGVHAMGGMAAQIPIKNDAKANQAAIDKVKADKLREVKDGHDGTWVAHPALVVLAKEIFDEHMPQPNQIDKKREDVKVTRENLLEVPQGQRTEACLRNNISVGVQYLEAWLGGMGCVPLHNLMEDAATAEIGRTQVWQWIHHKATLDDKDVLTTSRFNQVLGEEMDKLRQEKGDKRYFGGHFEEARGLFSRFSTSEELSDFLTNAAYDYVVDIPVNNTQSKM